MNGRQIIEAILHKYTSPDGQEIHCRTIDLKLDLISIFDAVLQAERNTLKMHEAWLRIEKSKETPSYWSNLFRKKL
jgi:hypothetical protein